MRQPWNFITDTAVLKERDIWGTTTYFFCEKDVQQTVKTELATNHRLVLSTGRLSKVECTEGLIVKTDQRPLHKRFASGRFFLDPVYGYMGVAGETLNTLVANQRGYQAHHLVAFRFNPVSFSSQAVFQRLVGWHSMHEALSEGAGVQDMLSSVADMLYANLSEGIFHGDTNISNVFFSKDTTDCCLIDMQVAVACRCSIVEGLALQLARLRDDRLAPFISDREYVEFVRSQLDVRSEGDAAAAIALFNQYYVPYMSKSVRHARLLEASKGQPDVMVVLKPNFAGDVAARGKG